MQLSSRWSYDKSLGSMSLFLMVSSSSHVVINMMVTINLYGL